MNRCYSVYPAALARRLGWGCALAGLAMACVAQAQGFARSFPPNALRGSLVVTYPPIIQMDGKPDQLSPGARIRGMNNMLVMSGAIIGQPLLVNYVRNPDGQVHDVWVLTEAEAALKRPNQP